MLYFPPRLINAPGNRTGSLAIQNQKGYEFRVTDQALADLFQSNFQSLPDTLAIAPGRVNLIGEHTDYNDGFVFPAAIDKEVLVAAGVSDVLTSLFSEQTGAGSEFDAGTVTPGQVEGWAAYAAGMAWVLREHTGQAMPNLRAMVS